MSTTTQIKVRGLAHADVERLVEYGTLTAYHGYVDGMQQEIHTLRDTKPAYPNTLVRGRLVPDTGAEPIGMIVRTEVHTIFGGSGETTFYTTEEAQSAAEERGDYDARQRLREHLYVEDPAGQEVSTAPIYGAQVSLTLFVKDVDADRARQVVQDALAAAFPEEALLRTHRLVSRPVHDRRVHVMTFAGLGEHDRMLAANVLAAEALYYANGHTFQTVPVAPSLDGQPVPVGL